MPETRESRLVNENSDRLKALGHPIRLAILRLIIQGPEEGTPAGEIQAWVGIPASTLSHHLSCLAGAQLVQVEREGTVLRYRAHFRILRALTDYLWKDCCSGGTRAASSEERPRTCCGVKTRRAIPS